jgi:hypothetical protein
MEISGQISLMLIVKALNVSLWLTLEQSTRGLRIAATCSYYVPFELLLHSKW